MSGEMLALVTLLKSENERLKKADRSDKDRLASILEKISDSMVEGVDAWKSRDLEKFSFRCSELAQLSVGVEEIILKTMDEDDGDHFRESYLKEIRDSVLFWKIVGQPSSDIASSIVGNFENDYAMKARRSKDVQLIMDTAGKLKAQADIIRLSPDRSIDKIVRQFKRCRRWVYSRIA